MAIKEYNSSSGTWGFSQSLSLNFLKFSAQEYFSTYTGEKIEKCLLLQTLFWTEDITGGTWGEIVLPLPGLRRGFLKKMLNPRFNFPRGTVFIVVSKLFVGPAKVQFSSFIPLQYWNKMINFFRNIFFSQAMGFLYVYH